MKYKYLLFLAIFLFIWLYAGVMHEQAHVSIYEYYGVDTEVQYFKNFPHFVTIAEEPCPNDFCRILNSENDLIQYNLNSILLLLTTGFTFLIYMLEKNKK